MRCRAKASLVTESGFVNRNTLEVCGSGFDVEVQTTLAAGLDLVKLFLLFGWRDRIATATINNFENGTWAAEMAVVYSVEVAAGEKCEVVYSP